MKHFTVLLGVVMMLNSVAAAQATQADSFGNPYLTKSVFCTQNARC